MQMKEVHMTPQWATALLEGNINNRPIRKKLVRAFAADMKTGRWLLNGEAILVSTSKRILDGQHRLRACVEANSSFPTWLGTEINDDVFPTIDSGASRNAKDVLTLAGENNPAALGAALTLLCKFRDGSLGDTSASITNGQRMESLALHPEIRESLAFAIDHRSPLPASVSAFVHWLGSRLDREATEAFLIQLSDGANLLPDSPALVLRNMITSQYTKRCLRQHNRDPYTAVAIKSLNAHLNNKPLGALKFSKRERFPQLSLTKAIATTV